MSWTSETLKTQYIGIYRRMANRIKSATDLSALQEMIKAMGEADFLDDFGDLNDMAFHLTGVEDAQIGTFEQDVFNKFQQKYVAKGKSIGWINLEFQRLHKVGFNRYKTKFKSTYSKKGYLWPDKWTSAGETHLIAAKTWEAPKSKKKK